MALPAAIPIITKIIMALAAAYSAYAKKRQEQKAIGNISNLDLGPVSLPQSKPTPPKASATSDDDLIKALQEALSRDRNDSALAAGPDQGYGQQTATVDDLIRAMNSRYM